MLVRAGNGVTWLLSFVVLSVACTGSEPLLLDATADAGTATPDTASACKTPELRCGGTCVDIQTSRDHCGRCDHACGAGDCLAGSCAAGDFMSVVTPFGMATSPAGLVVGDRQGIKLCARADGCATIPPATLTVATGASRLAVSETDVYFDGARIAPGTPDTEHTVLACKLAGCPLPRMVESMPDKIAHLAIARLSPAAPLVWARAGKTTASFTRCSGPGCAPPFASWTDAAADSFVSVGDKLVVWKNGTRLRSCPVEGSCAPSDAADLARNNIAAVAYGAGKHYLAVIPVPTGAPRILALDEAAPSNAPGTVVTDPGGVTAIAIDDSGLYWVSGTEIRHCRDPEDCSAPELVATIAPGTLGLALDARFLYWSTATSVTQLAKTAR